MAQATTTAKRPQKRGQPQKREQKRDQQRNWAHGNFHWNELRTRDAERARRFYADTIGWTFEAMATPDGHTYWVAMQDGKPVAGLFPLTSPQFDEVPESWMSFLAVDDVDSAWRRRSRPAPGSSCRSSTSPASAALPCCASPAAQASAG